MSASDLLLPNNGKPLLKSLLSLQQDRIYASKKWVFAQMKKIIPHIDQLQRAASEVRAARDVAEIADGLKYFLTYYDVLNYNLLYGFPLWRARRCNDKRGFANTREIYYPPARCAKIGRLNEAESPMLYTSFNIPTTLKELKSVPGEYVQVAGYVMPPTRPIQCLILGEFLNVHRRGQGMIPGC